MQLCVNYSHSSLVGWKTPVRAQKQSDFSTTNIVYSYARHEHVHVLLCPHQPHCSEVQQYLSYPRTTVEWNAVHAADHQDCCGMEPPCNAAVQAQSVNHTQSSTKKEKKWGGCYFLSFSVYLSVVNSSLCGSKGN